MAYLYKLLPQTIGDSTTRGFLLSLGDSFTASLFSFSPLSFSCKTECQMFTMWQSTAVFVVLILSHTGLQDVTWHDIQHDVYLVVQLSLTFRHDITCKSLVIDKT